MEEKNNPLVFNYSDFNIYWKEHYPENEMTDALCEFLFEKTVTRDPYISRDIVMKCNKIPSSGKKAKIRKNFS